MVHDEDGTAIGWRVLGSVYASSHGCSISHWHLDILLCIVCVLGIFRSCCDIDSFLVCEEFAKSWNVRVGLEVGYSKSCCKELYTVLGLLIYVVSF